MEKPDMKNHICQCDAHLRNMPLLSKVQCFVGWQGFLNGPCQAKVKSAQAKKYWYPASHLQCTSISLFYNYKSNILNLTANLSEKIQYEKNGCCVLSFSNAL